MKTTTLKTILRLSLVAILAWTVDQTLVSGQEQSGGKRASDLEGTWRVQVTVRDCQTRVPIRTILALNTYLREGSMMETGSGSFMRSPSHGTWHDTGHRNFTATFIFFRFNSDGTPAGTQKVTRNIIVGPNPDEFNAVAAIEIFDVSGNLISTGCATETAQRFK